MNTKYFVLISLLLMISGCGESNRYPNAQACGNGQNMMERGEGFSTKEWNNWCDVHGVSQ